MKHYNTLVTSFLLFTIIFFPIQGMIGSSVFSQPTQQRSFLQTNNSQSRIDINEQISNMQRKIEELRAQEYSKKNIIKQFFNPFNAINMVIFDIMPVLYYKLKKSSHKISKWCFSYMKQFSY